RRHTSSYGDWSSDVCSSDLLEAYPQHVAAAERGGPGAAPVARCEQQRATKTAGEHRPAGETGAAHTTSTASAKWQADGCPCPRRSEERRVGREWRPTGWA